MSTQLPAGGLGSILTKMVAMVVAAMTTTTTIRRLLRARPVVTAIVAAARRGDYIAHPICLRSAARYI
jgi:hypothetical protein